MVPLFHGLQLVRAVASGLAAQITEHLVRRSHHRIGLANFTFGLFHLLVQLVETALCRSLGGQM